jgi:hypothetical protein
MAVLNMEFTRTFLIHNPNPESGIKFKFLLAVLQSNKVITVNC